MNDEKFQKQRLELALEAAGMDLWENDLATGEITRVTSQIYGQLGYNTTDELPKSINEIFALMHPDDVKSTRRVLRLHIEGETQRYYCEFRLRAKNGAWVWIANYGRMVDCRQDQRSRRYLTGVSFNIDQRKQQEEHLKILNERLVNQNALLEKLAVSDSLTGVANRRYLLENGESEFQRARHHGQPLSVLMIDIDRFKQINDALGHPVGDRVIQAVAGICMHNVRERIDVVGRIGGEEFAIVLPGIAVEAAIEIAERLRHAIGEQPIELSSGNSVAVTISAGVAELTSGDRTFSDIRSRADSALYRAKRAGRDRVCNALDLQEL